MKHPSEHDSVAESRFWRFWALRLSMFWFTLSVLIFGLTYVLCETGDVPQSNRLLLFLAIATLLIIACIWQAVGFIMAHVTIQTKARN